MTGQVVRRHFTVTQYERMAEAGILTEDDRVELIEGEITEMSPIGSHHAGCINRLIALLTGSMGPTAILTVQNPLRLADDSEPQPDVMVLRARADFYTASHPTPADVLLLLEVADSSIDYDRGVKLPLYAQAAIAEYWLINLIDQTVEAYTQPIATGYQAVVRAGRGDSLRATLLPDLNLPVDRLFN